MQIILDFDGTLIDSRERVFRVFDHLLPGHGFTFDEYWTLKRSGRKHAYIFSEILALSAAEELVFHTRWMELIESPEWLSLDKPLSGALEALEALASNGHVLYLLTARQREDLVRDQLEAFGMLPFFAGILVTGQQVSKTDLLKARVTAIAAEDVLIGDTPEDIQTAKAVPCRSAAVDTGFLSLESLSKYQPDILVSDISDPTLWTFIHTQL